jgi:hypothetical protein
MDDTYLYVVWGCHAGPSVGVMARPMICTWSFPTSIWNILHILYVVDICGRYRLEGVYNSPNNIALLSLYDIRPGYRLVYVCAYTGLYMYDSNELLGYMLSDTPDSDRTPGGTC